LTTLTAVLVDQAGTTVKPGNSGAVAGRTRWLIPANSGILCNPAQGWQGRRRAQNDAFELAFFIAGMI
jgi:hypothetical protein